MQQLSASHHKVTVVCVCVCESDIHLNTIIPLYDCKAWGVQAYHYQLQTPTVTQLRDHALVKFVTLALLGLQLAQGRRHNVVSIYDFKYLESLVSGHLGHLER